MRERRLARELREARIGAQLAGNAVANALGWSTSKVSRIETGRIGISAADLDLLIELYERARRAGRIPAAARAGRPDPRLVGRLRRLAVRRVCRPAAAGVRFAGAAELLRGRPAPAADDARLHPAGGAGDLAATVAAGDRPAGPGVPAPAGRPRSGRAASAADAVGGDRRGGAAPIGGVRRAYRTTDGVHARSARASGRRPPRWPNVTHSGAAVQRRHSRRSAPDRSRSWNPGRPARPMWSTWRTRPGSSSSTAKPRSTGTPGTSSC